MIREKYSVIIMMIALSMGQVALAQKVEHVKRFEPVSKLQNQKEETLPEWRIRQLCKWTVSQKRLLYRKTGSIPSITIKIGK